MGLPAGRELKEKPVQAAEIPLELPVAGQPQTYSQGDGLRAASCPQVHRQRGLRVLGLCVGQAARRGRPGAPRALL